MFFCCFYSRWIVQKYIPMLCWVCCNTEPNAIKSLAGVRLRDCEYPSPKYDASATALGGALDISVKIVLNFTEKLVARKSPFSCNSFVLPLYTPTNSLFRFVTEFSVLLTRIFVFTNSSIISCRRNSATHFTCKLRDFQNNIHYKWCAVNNPNDFSRCQKVTFTIC